jgi:Tfp pilus assembly protein PilF
MPTRLEQLTAFHARDPKDPFIAYAIALEYLKLADTPAALRWLDTTLAIDADYAYAYYQKAKALADAGDTTQARSVIQQGLSAARRKGDSHAASELAALGDSF